MSKDITSFIKSCNVCEKYMTSKCKEPLLPHSVPLLRFNKVGVDILEFGGYPYLVAINHFSHWIETQKLTNKTSKNVTDAMQNIFTRFGYPETVIADNLPFVSHECKTYYREKDISIFTCSLHHHRSNGMAEKAVSIAKQILCKSMKDGTDYRESIMERLRTLLAVISTKLEPKVQSHIYYFLRTQQITYENNYDKSSKKSFTNFKKGDKVVIKTDNEKTWQKATIIKKVNEPRSYWIQRHSDLKMLQCSYFKHTSKPNQLVVQNDVSVDAEDNNRGNVLTKPPIENQQINMKSRSGRIYSIIREKLLQEKDLTFGNATKKALVFEASKLGNRVLSSSTEGKVKEDNFKEAWKILKSNFKNTRLIVQDHIYTILTAPKLIKSSHRELRKLLDAASSNISALKILEYPVVMGLFISFTGGATYDNPANTLGSSNAPKLSLQQQVDNFWALENPVMRSNDVASGGPGGRDAPGGSRPGAAEPPYVCYRVAGLGVKPKDVKRCPKNVFDDLQVILIQLESVVMENLYSKFAEIFRSGVSAKEKRKTRRLTKEQFYRQMPNGEKILRSRIVHSPSKSLLYCFCCRLFAPLKTGSAFGSERNLTSGGNSIQKSVNMKTALATWKTLQDGQL
ncbi:hypothetical protein ILUMI_23448 [Ignelater luminosus]|uniref:Integrase catalytic domain-containing protein n=1 Tax=Ignelater luminosus TaxID=2038154 RepID=A0A8K0CFA1_IGNLU|nr:hypothetical protein ILUMI_23448 [Ignelater luminosus]